MKQLWLLEIPAVRRYIAGVIDAMLGRRYSDGVSPPHRFQICIPLNNPYRLGYLDGMALAQLQNR